MLPADNVSLVATERHRDRERAAARRALVAPPSLRLRAATSLRRLADRLDAGPPEPASMIPRAGRGRGGRALRGRPAGATAAGSIAPAHRPRRTMPT
jgi:hypothetical protein